MTQMTVELLKATLPKAMQSSATQEWADHINAIVLDPEVAEEVRNNFLSYTKVLQEGKFKTESYLDAVTYVTHKLMGYSNQDAYIRTFPQRYQTLVARGISAKDLSAYVAAYHSNKLVNLILEQSIVPSWLLNRDVYQRAINTQFELMTDVDVSAKVRSDAANSILTHLKQPEAQKVELEIGVKQSGGVADLMATMRQLAKQQQELIQAGVPARQVARQKLTVDGAEEVVDAEFHDVSTAKSGMPGQPALTRAEVAAGEGPTAERPFTDHVPAGAVTLGDLVHRGPPPETVTLPHTGPVPQPVPLGGGQAVSKPASMFDAQPGNPGVPPVPRQSLFSPSPQPSAASSQGASDAAASSLPGATAAQPPASAEGKGAGVEEGATAGASRREAAPTGVSLFDPSTFPIEAGA